MKVRRTMAPETTATTPLGAWLERLSELLPGDGSAVTAAEQAAILDLARVAAHASERIAAPISTYLVGIALHDLEPSARAARIAELVATLERDART